jgi:hypothetical protein
MTWRTKYGAQFYMASLILANSRSQKQSKQLGYISAALSAYGLTSHGKMLLSEFGILPSIRTSYRFDKFLLEDVREQRKNVLSQQCVIWWFDNFCKFYRKSQLSVFGKSLEINF